ncbi:MAG: helix-turn-helix transcriptional regulator [Clostridia bacterium]|nr:helix-turn-helix transcriptional regulator [Clostridia bacterium]
MKTDYFKNIIKAYRISNNYTKERFAELLDVDPSYISKIESGDRMPSVEMLIKISNKTNISLDEMFCTKTSSGAELRMNKYLEKINCLSPSERQFVFEMLDKMLEHLSEEK